MKIDAEVLTQAINEHKDDKFQKDFREWLVYTAPPEVQSIFKNYTEKMQAQDAQNKKVIEESRLFITVMMVAVLLFVVYQLVFVIPSSCN